MVKTLISTLHKGGAVLAAINKLSPERLILIVIDPLDPVRKKALNNIKNNFSKFIDIKTVATELYDIPTIVKDVCKVIDEEYRKKNEISIHISESRKTQALGALFAGFIKKDKIKGVYYIEEENNKLLQMPLLNFRLSSTKTKILREIVKGNKKISKIIAKVGKAKSIVYSHITDLKKDGFITEDLELTDSGKISVM